MVPITIEEAMVELSDLLCKGKISSIKARRLAGFIGLAAVIGSDIDLLCPRSTWFRIQHEMREVGFDWSGDTLLGEYREVLIED